MSGIMDAIGSIVPWLTTALTSGPVGVAAMAASKIAGAIGLSDSSVSSVKDALSSLTMTADQKLALQKAENDFQLQMRQMGFTAAHQLMADENDRLSIINKTMQTEEALNNWYAADWRPTFGYAAAALFIFVGVMTCIMEAYIVFMGKTDFVDAIPKLVMAFIPLFGIAGGILGIQAWNDGKSDGIIASLLGKK